MASKSPSRVAVPGAAGNIGYAAIFRLASGAVFGPDQPVALDLIEVGPGLNALAAALVRRALCGQEGRSAAPLAQLVRDSMSAPAADDLMQGELGL